MGTKNVTSSTNQYNAPSMNAYHALTSAGTGAIQSNIANPYGNAFFQSQQAAAQGAAANFGASAGGANRQIFSALGTPTTNSFLNSQNGYQNRANLSLGARMNNNLILGAADTRNQSINAGMAFRPLQTGGTMTQQTGGLGTWLPQVASAAAAAGMGALQKKFGNGNGNNSSTGFAGGYFNNGQIGSGNTLSGLSSNMGVNNSGFDSNGNALAY